MIISVLFFTLAAICNALMDTLQFHWYKFRWNNQVNSKFWNPAISWKNKYIDFNPKKGLKYKGFFGFMVVFTDAWHFIKMLMIVFLSLAVVCFPFSFQFCIFNSSFLNGLLWVILLGLCWNIPFGFFMNKVFVKDESE